MPTGGQSITVTTDKRCVEMSRIETTCHDMELRRKCLYAELYQRAATMDIHSLERLCRRIHCIEIKTHSFKGGIYGK